jgi:hypothetical protein
MTETVVTSPPNSICLITDVRGGIIPDRFDRGEGVISTDSCIVVSCLAEMDGETEFTIGPARDVDPGNQPSFEGTLLTPNRIVVVSTVESKTLLEERVPTLQTRLRVWTNHPNEPDKVIIGLG